MSTLATEPPTSDDAFERISRFLYDASGIVVPRAKSWLIDTRLSPVLRSHGFSDLSALARHLVLTKDPELQTQIIDAMTTNETSFFRDHHVFDELTETVLPEVLERNRARRRLRIWSAACSSGQEPYSLAILLRSHFPTLANWDVKILATDLCTDVLAIAKKGWYRRHEIQRGLTEAERTRFFTQQQGDRYWAASPDLQSLIDFRPHNLVKDRAPQGPWDIILLRNVLIYFDESTRKRVISGMRRVMPLGGTLLLGSTESASVLPPGCFDRVESGRAQLFCAKEM